MRRVLVWAMGVVAVALVAGGLWLLERPRQGLEIEALQIGTTPATVMRRPGAEGPLVVIAHGFAGSRQLMQSFQLTLARTGYVTLAYDLRGHGRNPVPMSGDVAAIDGTTRILLEEMDRVIAAGRDLPDVDGRVALVGHSMSSDLVVRAAQRDAGIGPVVAVSLYSQAITAEAPDTLLILNGQFEPHLRTAADRYMAQVGGEEGTTVGVPGDGAARRAVSIAGAEHVGILFARQTMEETRAWLDAAFDRSGTGTTTTGPGIIALMTGLALLVLPLSRLVPRGSGPGRLPTRVWAVASLVPMLAAPLILAPLDTRFLPVLVADYLALHLAVYGALALGLLAVQRSVHLRLAPLPLALLVVYALGCFGLALDRYVGSFWPIPERLPILLAILPGAVLAMLADAALTDGGAGPRWRRLAQRTGFLASLGIAVALDFERLFFLVLIVPVIVLFFLTFGLMGGTLARRTGSGAAMGVGLGLVLAWSLAVTFPLFQS